MNTVTFRLRSQATPVHAPVPTRCVSPAAVRLALIHLPTVRFLFNYSLSPSPSLPLLAVTHPSKYLQESPDDFNFEDVEWVVRATSLRRDDDHLLVPDAALDTQSCSVEGEVESGHRPGDTR